MTNKRKILERFFNTPTSLKFNQIEKILLHYGFTKKQGKGSHQKFKHPDIPIQLIFPVHNNDCKNIYKNFALMIINQYLT